MKLVKHRSSKAKERICYFSCVVIAGSPKPTRQDSYLEVRKSFQQIFDRNSSQSTRRPHVSKRTSLSPKLAILKLISLAFLTSFCFWNKSLLTPGRSNQAEWAARCACSLSCRRRITRGAQWAGNQTCKVSTERNPPIQSDTRLVCHNQDANQCAWGCPSLLIGNSWSITWQLPHQLPLRRFGRETLL